MLFSISHFLSTWFPSLRRTSRRISRAAKTASTCPAGRPDCTITASIGVPPYCTREITFRSASDKSSSSIGVGGGGGGGGVASETTRRGVIAVSVLWELDSKCVSSGPPSGKRDSKGQRWHCGLVLVQKSRPIRVSRA